MSNCFCFPRERLVMSKDYGKALVTNIGSVEYGRKGSVSVSNLSVR